MKKSYGKPFWPALTFILGLSILTINSNLFVTNAVAAVQKNDDICPQGELAYDNDVAKYAICTYQQGKWSEQSDKSLLNQFLKTDQTTTAPLPTERSENKNFADPSRFWWVVVYQMFYNNNWEIENGHPTRLTDNIFRDVNPSYNLGAQKVAFDSDRDGNEEIYVMNADGSNPARLTASEGYDGVPDWSSVNHRILFVSERDGNPEIYVMNADGSSQIRLTYDVHNDSSPTWSPDGKQIAWVRVDGNNGTLWLMN